jgi:hypothetical protein
MVTFILNQEESRHTLFHVLTYLENDKTSATSPKTLRGKMAKHSVEVCDCNVSRIGQL